ncbi:unnamed protein product [Symbiodinium natans]|uniref:Major facilitator superfamily (MFS) profile domain-containing protein n=1 Tax=Symbiodinium natans TaxID=878477 RepID=A0A812S5L4_9DINO|nr:unnamed protein product [Symbiodinium natans]
METMEMQQQLAGSEPDPEDYRKNIRCIFASLFSGVALSAVTLGPLFDAYLLNIGGVNGNKLVGAVESTRGILQLVLAYPIGAMSDKMSRIRLMKWDLPFWTLGLGLLVIGVVLDNLPLLFIGIAIWAPCSQCWNSTAQVVVADSAPAGERTKVISRMTSLRLVALASGPLLQALMLLASRQNHWGSSLLRSVILSGCVLWPGVLLWTLRLQDVPPLEKTTGNSRQTEQSVFDAACLDRRHLGIPVRWWLAGTLEFTSFVTAMGAGMTVKFFPLFFRVDYHFTPLEICILSCVYPLCISAMVEICRRVSKRLGRLMAVMLFHFLGTACLWAMCYIRPLVFVLPLYLLRGALMNARGPIVRSIVMDLVTSDLRGRWNSIQSLSGFTWSGSAALGGYLADSAGDYRFTFVVTALIYTVSFFIGLPLYFIYPSEKVPAASPQARDVLPPAGPGTTGAAAGSRAG